MKTPELSGGSPNQQVTPREFFGDTYTHWQIVMEAARLFARADGCPLGHNIFDWLQRRNEELHQAMVASPSETRQ